MTASYRSIPSYGFVHCRIVPRPDVGLQGPGIVLVPVFTDESCQEAGKEDRDILILTATSGDTGKAALEGFKDVAGTDIMVFYPSEGVRPMQKQQMQKQEGNNVKVSAIYGNFDDAQSF